MTSKNENMFASTSNGESNKNRSISQQIEITNTMFGTSRAPNTK